MAVEVFSGNLVDVTGESENNHGACRGSDYYRQPLVGDKVEIAHQCYSRRHKEETEIFDKKVCRTLNIFELYNPETQAKSEEQHTDNAGWYAGAGDPHYQLSDSEKRKNHCQLNNSHNQ